MKERVKVTVLFCLYQEEETSVQITEKGGHQAKLDLVWTKDDIATVDFVCNIIQINFENLNFNFSKYLLIRKKIGTHWIQKIKYIHNLFL